MRAGPGVHRLDVPVAEVIGVNVTQRHRVNLSETRVGGAGHRLPRVVKNTRAIRILEDHGPIPGAELWLPSGVIFTLAAMAGWSAKAPRPQTAANSKKRLCIAIPPRNLRLMLTVLCRRSSALRPVWRRIQPPQ
jgi:hypothetical protein